MWLILKGKMDSVYQIEILAATGLWLALDFAFRLGIAAKPAARQLRLETIEPMSLLDLEKEDRVTVDPLDLTYDFTDRLRSTAAKHAT